MPAGVRAGHYGRQTHSSQGGKVLVRSLHVHREESNCWPSGVYFCFSRIKCVQGRAARRAESPDQNQLQLKPSGEDFTIAHPPSIHPDVL